MVGCSKTHLLLKKKLKENKNCELLKMGLWIAYTENDAEVTVAQSDTISSNWTGFDFLH